VTAELFRLEIAMFDRPPETAASFDRRTAAQGSAERLCAAYDRLLALPDVALSDGEIAELTAMAGIYDLNTDRPLAEIWRDLRMVITRQAPRSGDKAQDGAVEVGSGPSFEPLTILLVEDDADTAADLTAALSEAGHSVVGPFHDAGAAEAAAALHRLDVGLLDINLSGEVDGVALARSLKSRWGLPILFLSGDVSAVARHADLAEALVLKPYTGRDVLAALAHLQSRGRPHA